MGKFVDGFVNCDNDIITRYFFLWKSKILSESLLKCQFIFIVEKVIKIMYLLICLSEINKINNFEMFFQH